MTTEQLGEYLAAWDRHDIDGIVERMTDDCAYHGSVGPDLYGTTSRGHAEVRTALNAFFAALPTARFIDVETFVHGDRGAAEWTVVWSDDSGQERRLRGCDLFEFDGDLIRTKNAFVKSTSR